MYKHILLQEEQKIFFFYNGFMEYFSTMTQNLHAIEKRTDIFDSIKKVFALENAINKTENIYNLHHRKSHNIFDT